MNKQQDELNELVRFRIEPTLSSALHAEATRLRVKPTDVARIALAVGLNQLREKQTAAQPAEVSHADK